MKDYKKEYEQALERAKVVNPGTNDYSIVTEIFPELKVSKDEKNIKSLIDELKLSLKAANCQNDATGGGHEKRIALLEWGIAWLEKQGKQKSDDKKYTFDAIPRLLSMIQPTDRAKTYCQKLIDVLIQEGYGADAKIVANCLKQMNGEKVAMATMDEQNTAWSEEDEQILNGFIESLRYCNGNGYNKQVDWLKFLKERYTWKPSDEQIEAFEHFVRGVGESGYASPYLKPIPLTAEILEKNGFTCDANDMNDSDEIVVSVKYGKYQRNTDDGFKVLSDGKAIKYVHELQHALRLCGIDKEIKL